VNELNIPTLNSTFQISNRNEANPKGISGKTK